MKKIGVLVFILGAFLSFSVIAAEKDKEHNDKEHEKAEKNLDHEHWEKAHGSGVPDKQPERHPPKAVRE